MSRRKFPCRWLPARIRFGQIPPGSKLRPSSARGMGDAPPDVFTIKPPVGRDGLSVGLRRSDASCLNRPFHMVSFPFPPDAWRRCREAPARRSAPRFSPSCLSGKTRAGGDAIFQELHIGVFKFDDFFAVHADEVVVGRVLEEIRVVDLRFSPRSNSRNKPLSTRSGSVR